MSPVMVEIAAERLAPWRDRARARLAPERPGLDVADGAFDRFVATYVLDLMSLEDIRLTISAAHS